MKTLTILFTTFMLLSGCATHQSPTGRNQVLLFSSQEIELMGTSSFTQIKEQEKISQDTAINHYVDCVAKRITAVLPNSGSAWDVVVFESEQVNAFALPGGHIGVYTGLLNVAQNEHQLATVIGHEVAHVLAKHSNEQVSRIQLSGIGMQVADVALGAGGISNKELYMAALGLGAQVGFILPYGRDQESEADVMGVELMARAGFDPGQSIVLWQNMAKKGGGEGPELLSTHPSHSHRIDDLVKMQQQVMPLYRASKPAVKNSCQFMK